MSLKKKLKNHKCRTCFQATKGLKSLTKLATDEKPQKSYAEILRQLANINIMEDKCKEITQFICGGCSRKLKAAYAFVLQAQVVNTRLLNMLDQDDSSKKQMDCLQESQVDIESCLEIKMEHDDIEGIGQVEVPQCEVELKLEEPEENILTDITTADILHTNIDEVTLDKFDLKSTNSNTNIKPSIDKSDEEIIDEDILNIEANKQNFDLSDFEDNNDDDSSNDSDWHEHLKAVKRTANTKSDKPEVDKTNIEDDIAVPCNECNKIFKNSKALAIHQSTSHIPEEQKCSCPLCGHKFTRSCNMYKHMRTFHGPDTVPLIRKPSSQERPYQCDKCSRNYVKKKHLNVHMRTKHSKENENNEKEKLIDSSTTDGKKPKRYEQPSLCSICGSSFTSKTFLIVHMRRHTGERPFKCDLCDRAYPRKTELTVHRRLHTGEKPFECKLCGKAFRVSGKLATHMRSHTDIRPYKCTQCERSFKYSKDLSIHFRIHTGERPYCCNVCGSTFTQSNSLKAHRMKLGHMETVV